MRKRTISGLWWLLLSSIVAACAPARIELDRGVRERLPAAAVVHVVAYPAKAPPLLTAGQIAVGTVWIEPGSRGRRQRRRLERQALMAKDLMVRNKVQDLSAQLADRLAVQLGGTLPKLQRASQPPPGDHVEELRRAGLRPFVLDVRSRGMFTHYPLNSARYRLLYKARARLVDTEQGQVLWQGICSVKGADEPAESPTLDELRAPDGEVYRRQITEATTACVSELVRQFHGQLAA